jgi:hypothetical protein
VYNWIPKTGVAAAAFSAQDNSDIPAMELSAMPVPAPPAIFKKFLRL